MTFLPAWVNKDGAVNFRRDVYNRDRQLAAEASPAASHRRMNLFGH